ncbi:MAG: 2TM domain-containing protein [Chloroflexi bacterium]|nr:2TM domain-containing protein [Chloroflexota bacterium]
MRDDNLDYTAIRRRVEVELQQQRRKGQIALFVVNCLIFFIFMLVTWVLVPDTSANFTLTDDMLAAMIMLSVGWATGLFLHGMAAFGIGSKSWTDQRRKQLLLREVEYARLGLDDAMLDEPAEKTKRSGKLRLSDEGELLDIVEEDYAAEEPRQQRRR